MCSSDLFPSHDTRYEQELILDVSKVDNDKALENLKVYIEDLWRRGNE